METLDKVEVTYHKNEIFGTIRTTVYKDVTLFVIIDIIKALKYAHPYSMMNKIVPENDITYLNANTGKDGAIYIKTAFMSEMGLYALILRSKMPYATKLRDWVIGEVLPSLRKTDEYKNSAKGKALFDPVRRAMELNEEAENYKNQLAFYKARMDELINDASIAELFKTSIDYCDVGTLAKHLKMAGFPYGKSRLYKWLRRNKYIMKPKYDQYKPTQWAIENEYVLIRTEFIDIDGIRHVVSRRPVITPKGAISIYKKIYEETISGDVKDADGYIILEEAKGSEAQLRKKEFSLRKKKKNLSYKNDKELQEV